MFVFAILKFLMPFRSYSAVQIQLPRVAVRGSVRATSRQLRLPGHRLLIALYWTCLSAHVLQDVRGASGHIAAVEEEVFIAKTLNRTTALSLAKEINDAARASRTVAGFIPPDVVLAVQRQDTLKFPASVNTPAPHAK